MYHTADDNLALTPYNSGGVLGAVGSGVGMIGSGAMYVHVFGWEG